jgi:CRP/FNR family transcriptional regulator, cyclic AMP receptor protein
MASSAATASVRSTRLPLQVLTQFETKENSPYGLPIVDDCAQCKLRNTNFFCSLSTPAMSALNEIKHSTSYPEGAIVFMEGQAARGVYIVCQGAAKLSTTSSDGKTFILKIARPGEALGAHAVIAETPHEVTVETLQPSQLAFIPRRDFLAFLKEHGDACLQAAQHLSRDCQSAYEVIRSIGLSHSVSEKLARLLLQWSVDAARSANGALRLTVTLTHEEIAQLLGSSRETVTRLLSDYKKQGVIEQSGATLMIRNKPALDKLAGQ